MTHMESFQFYWTNYYDIILIYLGLIFVFILIYVNTDKDYKRLLVDVFLLLLLTITAWNLTDLTIFLTLPVFLLLIQNVFNNKNFHRVITAEEDHLFEVPKQTTWQQFSVPPELKGVPLIEDQNTLGDEKLNE